MLVSAPVSHIPSTSIYVVFGEELKSSTLGGPEGARKHVFLRARKTFKNLTNIVKSMVPGQDV